MRCRDAWLFPPAQPSPPSLGLSAAAAAVLQDAERFGVYATPAAVQRAAYGWWGRLAGWAAPWRAPPNATLAAFPLSTVLTAGSLAAPATPAAEAALGATPEGSTLLRELLELGLLDERTAVLLHLAVQRRIWQQQQQQGRGGAASAQGLGPWLALLPQEFTTPLFFSDGDLDWLRGTTLHAAANVRRRALQASWQRLEPAARELAAASGARGATPSLADFQWAHSLFWSRAISFPCRMPAAAAAHDGGASASCDAASSDVADGDGAWAVVMQEGLVPGLDFCNHAGGAACRWTVFGAEEARARAGGAPEAVSLVCPRGTRLLAGQELTINYGDKSNEELLFLYGFAEQDNPHEVLTVVLPLPQEVDETLQARLQVLQQRGHRPQIFLPAVDLAALASGGAKQQQRGGGAAARSLPLPEGVAGTLEVFVMDRRQLAAELEGAAAAAGAAGAQGAAVPAHEEEPGLRLAVLTTLVRLLELKVAGQEGEEKGTGTLEDDEALLARAGDALPLNQRHALVYRIGQKRLARSYLAHSSRLLQAEMERMARLQDGGGK
eukprot:scaffold5.g944.t1